MSKWEILFTFPWKRTRSLNNNERRLIIREDILNYTRTYVDMLMQLPSQVAIHRVNFSFPKLHIPCILPIIHSIHYNLRPFFPSYSLSHTIIFYHFDITVLMQSNLNFLLLNYFTWLSSALNILSIRHLYNLTIRNNDW